MVFDRTDHGETGRLLMGRPANEPVGGEKETVAGAKDNVHEFEVGREGGIIDRQSTRMDGVLPLDGKGLFDRSWH